MKKKYFLSILFISSLSFAQVAITKINNTYTQNFDGMGATGTSLPTHWSAIRASGTGTSGADLSPIADNGSANSGGVYNVGATNSTERALGSLGSGSTVPAFGISFINNADEAISEITISADVEQWRSGSSSTVNESLVFEYSLNATSLNSGDWVPVTILNVNEIQTTSISAVNIDGDDATNKSTISAKINLTTTPWNNATKIYLRWTDANDAGSDGLLAIDNFELKATISSLSTPNFNEIEGLSVYPNPAKEIININSATNGKKSVTVYDILGKQVITTVISNNILSVSQLTKGIYILRISESGKSSTRKLIIE